MRCDVVVQNRLLSDSRTRLHYLRVHAYLVRIYRPCYTLSKHNSTTTKKNQAKTNSSHRGRLRVGGWSVQQYFVTCPPLPPPSLTTNFYWLPSYMPSAFTAPDAIPHATAGFLSTLRSPFEQVVVVCLRIIRRRKMREREREGGGGTKTHLCGLLAEKPCLLVRGG